MASLYDRDFLAWTEQTAAHLRAGRLDDLDLNHLAEEVEDMGRSEWRSLESQLANLLAHRLKWEYQPERRTSSWRLSIVASQIAIGKLVKRNPSMKGCLGEVIEEAYSDARKLAAADTGLPEDTFPPACPWTQNDLLAS